MTLDIQIEMQRQAIARLNNEVASLKTQQQDFEDGQQATNTIMQQRLDNLDDAISTITNTVDILSLALAEQYEQSLAISEQQTVTMAAIAELYEEIMIYEEMEV